jgi:hypothetical protein
MLCEFVAAQLHPFPRVTSYRPHVNEPNLNELERIAILEAHEGFGKTAWAGNVGTHSANLVTYFRCAGVESEAVAPRLVREAAALLARASSHRVADVLLPGATGLEALSHLDALMAKAAVPLVMIVDDANRVDARTIVDAVEVTSHIQWVILGRPGTQLQQVAARLRVQTQRLQGWSIDTIASVIAGGGCTSSPREAASLQGLTGGAPLFVVQAIESIQRRGGSTETFLGAVEHRVSATSTAQEILLGEALTGFSASVLTIAAAIASTGIAATFSAWREIVAVALSLPGPDVDRGIRHVTAQILTENQVGTIAAHDAFRAVLRGVQLGPDEERLLRAGLKNHLQTLLPNSRNPAHLLALLKALSDAGDFNDLSDVASGTAEILRELGIAPEARAILLASLPRAAGDSEASFWIEDTLAYFELLAGDAQAARQRLDRMQLLLKAFKSTASERGAFLNKSILVHGTLGTSEPVSIESLHEQSDDLRRVASYNVAVLLGRSDDPKERMESLSILGVLIAEYLEIVKLRLDDLVGMPPLPKLEELSQKIPAGTHTDNVRWLGDCFDATSRIAQRTLAPNHPLAMFTLPAMKLYNLAHAPKSLAKAARSQADWFLSFGDRVGAEEMLANHALPAATAGGIITDALLVRGQLAEVRALLGRSDQVQAELEALKAYSPSTSDDSVDELRASLARAEQYLRLPATLPSGWYGIPGSIGLTSRNVQLRAHGDWTIAVGQDAVDRDWGFQAKRGPHWSCGEFMMDQADPLNCTDFYQDRETAYHAAQRAIGASENDAEILGNARKAAREKADGKRREKKRRRKEQKKSRR